jgi:hypothetical protein
VFLYPESLQHEFGVDKIFFNRAVPPQEQTVALVSARKIFNGVKLKIPHV